MDYTIELSENRMFLKVKAMSQINIDIVRQWSADIDEKSRAMNIRRFLFDVRSAHNVATILENILFAHKDSAELKLSKNVRSAILVSETDGSHNLAETALRNAGYNVRIFKDELTAVEWLEKERR